MRLLPHLVLALALAVTGARAGSMPEFTLVIQGTTFQPATLEVPSGTRIKLLVRNQNATPSEFESNDFNREQIVLPGTTATVYVGPLAPGRYEFFDDFHRDGSRGTLLVK